MTGPLAPPSPGRDEPADPAATVDDQAVLLASDTACRRHGSSVTVMELVWAWTADLWWDAVTGPNPAVDPMTIPHAPSRADLARVRRRLTALHRHGLAVRGGNPSRWQPRGSSNEALDELERDSLRTEGWR